MVVTLASSRVASTLLGRHDVAPREDALQCVEVVALARPFPSCDGAAIHELLDELLRLVSNQCNQCNQCATARGDFRESSEGESSEQ